MNKDELDIKLKNYFESEVSRKIVPSIPSIVKTRKKKISWDNLFLAACITACLSLMTLPSTYDSGIRKLHISRSKYNAFKDEVPRIIFDASLYFKNSNKKRSQK